MARFCGLCQHSFPTQYGYLKHIRLRHKHPKPHNSRSTRHYHPQLDGICLLPFHSSLAALLTLHCGAHVQPAHATPMGTFCTTRTLRRPLKISLKTIRLSMTALALRLQSCYMRRCPLRRAMLSIFFVLSMLRVSSMGRIQIHHHSSAHSATSSKPSTPSSTAMQVGEHFPSVTLAPSLPMRQLGNASRSSCILGTRCTSSRTWPQALTLSMPGRLGRIRNLMSRVHVHSPILCPVSGHTSKRCVSPQAVSENFTDARFQDMIAVDPNTHGAMFTPVCLGIDKTCVSVATGNQEFHPAYLMSGNVTNEMRRAHRDASVPIAFLPIAKGAYVSLFRSLCAFHRRLQRSASTMTPRNSASSRSKYTIPPCGIYSNHFGPA